MYSNLLENNILKVGVNAKGAELNSLYSKKNSLELLWQADRAYWPRHAPVLFPIVGRLKNDKLVHQGAEHHLTQHGFARDAEFDCIYQDEQLMQWRLRDSEHSMQAYPFKFEFVLEYQLRENKLITRYIIRNSDASPLPVSVGAHPAFNWPLLPETRKEDYLVELECDEASEIVQLENGLAKRQKVSSPLKGRELYLNDELFAHDALIWDSIKSHQLTYRHLKNNSIAIKLQFEDLPQLGIWTKPGAPFICLEPWYGYASPEDFDGEFIKKPGLMHVQPWSERTLRYVIEVLEN